MKATLHPSRLKGVLSAPASKSSMQRACAAALIKPGHTLIRNPGNSNDDRAAVRIVEELGAVRVEYLADGNLEIISDGVKQQDTTIHCGESGLSARMFTPIAALNAYETVITGEGSLLQRPFEVFDQIFPRLAVEIRSHSGKLPLQIRGPLRPGTIEVDGSLSSQFLTGLLMAYSAADAKDVSIRVKDLKSRPYIDLTLDVMKAFGMKLPENHEYREFHFPAEPHLFPFTDQEYTVERDWSGGAFLLVAGAIAGPVRIRGLDPASAQADKAILDALISANAAVAIEAKGIVVHPGHLDAFQFNATDCPDLFPPLVALAAYSKGESRIRGVNRLTHKESNRALTLQEEFGRMGVRIDLEKDIMVVHGGAVQTAHVHSRHDHRIAMACAVAALGAEGTVVIDEVQAVDKSYPGFFRDLKSLGVDVSLQ